jgi:hypothetical protein
MPDSESKARLSVKLTGILDRTSSWVRVLEDGRIELEHYDFSSAAQADSPMPHTFPTAEHLH